MKKTNSNLDRENYSVKESQPPTKAKQYSKPVLPKVLVALLVILLMAVIALSFVLYHIDQDLRSNKEKVRHLSVLFPNVATVQLLTNQKAGLT